MTSLRPKLIVSDLDGTLLPRDGAISPLDIMAFAELGNLGLHTAIATGRSLFSYNRSKLPELPLDYLVYATGAGIRDLRLNTDLSSINLSAEISGQLARMLYDMGVDFMMQGPVPDNHYFTWWSRNDQHPDFKRRLNLYQGYHRRIQVQGFEYQACSQAIVIADETEGLALLKSLRTLLPAYKVVRTTSPIDHRSLWIEIFPKDVSKGHALERLSSILGISRDEVWALGNDYNDLDMLEYAGRAFVVDNAPGDLLEQFEPVDAKSPISVLTGLVKLCID
jgi:Cof subfamily protein (haloacid dehalogenase superfamily)